MTHYIVFGTPNTGKTTVVLRLALLAMEQSGVGQEATQIIPPPIISDKKGNPQRELNNVESQKLKEKLFRAMNGLGRGYGDAYAVVNINGKKIAFYSRGDFLQDLWAAREFAEKNHCDILVSAYRSLNEFRDELLRQNNSSPNNNISQRCIITKLIRCYPGYTPGTCFTDVMIQKLLDDILDNL